MCHFTILVQKNAQNMAGYYTVEHDKKYGLRAERQNGRTKLYFISGIINALFDGLTYNSRGHFAHCSYFSSLLPARKNTTQLAKYPRELYVKQSNKVNRSLEKQSIKQFN